MLSDAGYRALSEKDPWELVPGGKYYIVRNHSTLIAFALGGKFKSGNGFNVIASHTDSPCLKLKPNNKVSKLGWEQVGVQLYGGGIWHTWFDRDLRVAGRAVVKSGDTFEHRLVHIDRALLRIPTIAIHLNREVNQKLEFNKETHLLPVIATSIKDQLGEADADAKYPLNGTHPSLIKLVAQEAGCAPEDLRDFELCLADHQPAAIGGVHEEFLFAPRLDNLHCAFTSLEALRSVESLDEEQNVLVAALFDNEEVGSQ